MTSSNLIEAIVAAVTARVRADLGLDSLIPAASPQTAQSAGPAKLTLEGLVNGAVEHDSPTASETAETVVKRRKRNYRPRVAYRLTKAGAKIASDKTRMAKVKEVLFPTTLETFRAIVKASPDPIHAGAIKAATGQKMKTIESDVYKLRTSQPALIESVSVK